jgi:hypothetical protein
MPCDALESTTVAIAVRSPEFIQYWKIRTKRNGIDFEQTKPYSWRFNWLRFRQSGHVHAMEERLNIQKTIPVWLVFVALAVSAHPADPFSDIHERRLVDVRRYNFAVQKPGGSISAGLCVFSLNPLPAGVGAGDTLFLSGGIGEGESVMVEGVSNNTIRATCRFAHSGAWTVASDSGGLKEALLSARAPSTIFLACGETYAIHTMILVQQSTIIDGCGRSAVVQLAPGFSSSAAITVSGRIVFELVDVVLDGNRVNNPIQTSAGVFVTGAVRFISRNCTYRNFNVGQTLELHNVSVPASVDHNDFFGNASHSIYVDNSELADTHHHIISNTVNGNITWLTSCSDTTPIVCTPRRPQPFYAGQFVTIRNASAAGVNGQWAITPIGSGPTYSSFSLNGSTAAGPSTGGTYTEGGFGVALINQGGAEASGNSMVGGSSEAISLTGSRYCRVTGNKSSFSGDSGITLSLGARDNFISDNDVIDSWFEGVLLTDSTAGTSGNVLRDNHVSGVTNAIARRGSGIAFFGLRVQGNIVRGGRSVLNPEFGIYLGGGAASNRVEDVNLSCNLLGAYRDDGTPIETVQPDNRGGLRFTINPSAPAFLRDDDAAVADRGTENERVKDRGIFNCALP